MVQLRDSMKLGYDIDGVITAGLVPPPYAAIVTGRSYEEAPETYAMLHKKGIFNAVYFNPDAFTDKTREKAGMWKGVMIVMLRIDEFFEDDPVQIENIKFVLSSSDHKCVINHVTDTGIKVV